MLKRLRNTPFEKFMNFVSIVTVYVAATIGLVAGFLALIGLFVAQFQAFVVYAAVSIVAALFTRGLMKTIEKEEIEKLKEAIEDDDDFDGPMAGPCGPGHCSA